MSGTAGTSPLKPVHDSQRPLTIPTPATALWNQRMAVAAMRDRFEKLSAAIDKPTDLNLYQWAEFGAFALEFRPDLILELGRELGNSTCCFIEVANRLGGSSACRVVSLCLSDAWFTHTVPRLASVVPPEWFAPAEINVGNLLNCDAQTLLKNAQRPLIFWDAHGFEVAEWVLGGLLPALVGKPHLVLMHDMSDTRFEIPSAAYGEARIWKGTNAGDLAVRPTSGKDSGDGETGAQKSTDGAGPALWLGHVYSKVSQAISIVDFTSRNRLPLHSGAESMHAEIASDPIKMTSLRELLGDDLFSLQAHWYWFALNEAPGALHFPLFRRSETAVDAAPPAKGPQDKERIETLWREVENSAGWRILNGWRLVRNHVLPENTRRRKLYDSALGTLRGHSRT